MTVVGGCRGRGGGGDGVEIQDVTATTILNSLISVGLVHVRWSELRARLLGFATVPCTLVRERTLVENSGSFVCRGGSICFPYVRQQL